MIQRTASLFKICYLVLIFSGCATSKKENLKQTQLELHDLWAATWLADSDTLKNAKMPFLELNTTTYKVYGNTGCNSFFGDFEVSKKGKITFSKIGNTLMYCENSYETLFLQHLENTSRYTRDGLTLTFYDNQKPLLIFKKVD